MKKIGIVILIFTLMGCQPKKQKTNFSDFIEIDKIEEVWINKRILKKEEHDRFVHDLSDAIYIKDSNFISENIENVKLEIILEGRKSYIIGYVSSDKRFVKICDDNRFGRVSSDEPISLIFKIEEMENWENYIN